MARAYQTNRRTVFCISFLSLQRPGWPSNRALKCGTLGKYEKPWETTAITAISPRKYLFWSRAISGETKKATPSDTLSVPLKISRSVWLYECGLRYGLLLCAFSYTANHWLAGAHVYGEHSAGADQKEKHLARNRRGNRPVCNVLIAGEMVL